MKKMIFLSLAVITMFSTAYAEETKAVEKAAAPLVSPKKPKPAECVAPAKPAEPAEAAKSATPVERAKSAEVAVPATQAKPAEAAKTAPGTCPPVKSVEAAKPAA